MRDVRTAVGDRMRAAREAAGLTVEQVAARITDAGSAVTSRTVARWEAGEVDQPMTRIYQFALAVGCHAGSLMCGPGGGR